MKMLYLERHGLHPNSDGWMCHRINDDYRMVEKYYGTAIEFTCPDHMSLFNRASWYCDIESDGPWNIYIAPCGLDEPDDIVGGRFVARHIGRVPEHVRPYRVNSVIAQEEVF